MSTAPIKVYLTPDGNVLGLYTEEIDLRGLGALSVQRASSVEFDNKSQKWQVCADLSWGDPSVVLYSNKSREACLLWEQKNIVKKIIKSRRKKRANKDS